MLSRTADNLYWMGRYVERAENSARFMGGVHRMSLIPVRGAEGAFDWPAIFHGEADKEGFLARHETFSAPAVFDYKCLDRRNPASIRSCIWAGRENVRATRHVLSTDLWENINRTWIEISGMSYADLEETGFQEFLEWVKERTLLFKGIAYGTLRRGEAFEFWRLGTEVERADNTLRLMTAHIASFNTAAGRLSVADYYRWGALLRSVNAYKTYREIYRSGLDSHNIAALLLLRDDMPRSLRACLEEIVEVLDKLRPGGSAAYTAHQLRDELLSARIDRIFRAGLASYLSNFLRAVTAMGNEIHSDFMLVR